MWLGVTGVAIFSLTLPFTRMAVAELHPVLVAPRMYGTPTVTDVWDTHRSWVAVLVNVGSISVGC